VNGGSTHSSKGITQTSDVVVGKDKPFVLRDCIDHLIFCLELANVNGGSTHSSEGITQTSDVVVGKEKPFV